MEIAVQKRLYKNNPRKKLSFNLAIWQLMNYNKNMQEKFQLDSVTIQNYRSFKDEQTLNLASRKILAIYGKNATGKTGFLKALDFIQWFIKNSANADLSSIPYNPFRLNTETNTKPSAFEINLSSNSHKLSYKFEVNASKVVSERLLDISSSRMKVIFYRIGDSYITDNAVKYGFGKRIVDSTRPNVLLITRAQEFNNPYSAAIFSCIDNYDVLTMGDGSLRAKSSSIIQHQPDIKEQVIAFFNNVNLKISDIVIQTYNIPAPLARVLFGKNDIPIQTTGHRFINIQTIHQIAGGRRNRATAKIAFDMATDESNGVNVLFDAITIILYSVQNNRTLFIDEFGASLDTGICNEIVKLYSKNRDSSARLVINSYDTALMKSLDAHEIILAKKNEREETVLIPLGWVRGARLSDDIEQGYREGRYSSEKLEDLLSEKLKSRYKSSTFDFIQDF